MKKELSYLISGMLIGALLASVGFAFVHLRNSNEVGAEVVLKLGHGLDRSHPVHKAMEFMDKRLQELSGGKVKIHIYPSSQLGSENQCIEQLRDGSLTMTKTSAASIENFLTEMSVFGYPYLFTGEEHYWEVLKSPIGTELLEALEPKGLRGLCYYDSGSRNFYTKDKPILTPDDLAGLKIRVMNSRTAMDMVSALGAAPTPIAWGELYTALAQGTVDGAENNPPSFTTNKHYEICRHFSLDGHTMVPDVVLISSRIWANLDPQVQNWIQQAADESSDFQRVLWKETTIKSLEEAKADGVQIHEVDKSLFAEKVKPMYDAIENKKIKDLVKRIRELK